MMSDSYYVTFLGVTIVLHRPKGPERMQTVLNVQAILSDVRAVKGTAF